MSDMTVRVALARRSTSHAKHSGERELGLKQRDYILGANAGANPGKLPGAANRGAVPELDPAAPRVRLDNFRP